MTKPTPEAPLTGLERELLGYVEQLATASKHSAAQFTALEKRSTDLINQRQDALEDCVKSLIDSQASLIAALTAFANASPNGPITQSFRQSMTALDEARNGLPKKE